MGVTLKKGQNISLKKDDGSKLEHFCVGCNWGAIRTKSFFGLLSSVKDVDLDLSCIMLDENGDMIDHIYSPLYKKEFLRAYGMPDGKLTSWDSAFHHSGDDLKGDTDGDDGLDNEIIRADLTRVSPKISQILFFLNNCGPEDFSQIPYASIRMYE
ncbi:MAG: TerD family protein, partial [Desulfovibrionaceae bacterium]|nr:TerD family protein [Desulfovibrionaceae bacterium]